MATIVLQVAGAVIGQAVGGPIGAQIGAAIGTYAGARIDASLIGGPTIKRTGPRLNDVGIQTSREGAAIPALFGRARVAGQIIWASKFKETAVKTRQTSGGGKGAPKSTVVTTDYVYSISFAVGLCEGAVGKLGFPIARLRRDYPRLIVCSISGFGESGPYAQRKAYDMLIQAESGLASITGTVEPSRVGVSVVDIASGMNAYALTDRGTWLSFKNRGDLVISVEGDKRLFNQYGVMLVNPAKHAHVKKAEGMAFIDWVTSAEGQKAIADYKIGGEQLFFPNAGK